ncbi:hypothetical protein [Rhizobium sp. PAMB 3182]
MNWADYQPGKRLVCLVDIEAEMRRAEAWNWFQQFKAAYRFPVKGAIYTVRDTMLIRQGLAIVLAEIVNPTLPFSDTPSELFFPAYYFRPVDETKLDQFRKHLTNIPTAVPA